MVWAAVVTVGWAEASGGAWHVCGQWGQLWSPVGEARYDVWAAWAPGLVNK